MVIDFVFWKINLDRMVDVNLCGEVFYNYCKNIIKSMQFYVLLIMMCNEFEVGQRILFKIVFYFIVIFVLVFKVFVVYREVVVQGREFIDKQIQFVGLVNIKKINFWLFVEYFYKFVIYQFMIGKCYRNFFRIF